MAQRARRRPCRASPGRDLLIRILCAGDSYTVGEAVAASDSWPHLLAGHFIAAGSPTTLVVAGRTGATAAEVRRCLAAAPAPPFDLVTVQAGVNDQYRGRAIEAYAADLTGLLDAAVALAGGRPRRVLMVSIPDWSVTPHGAGRDRAAAAAAIDAFNEAAAVVAAAAAATWVDVTPASRLAAADPSLTAGDGLHPAPAMYAAWMEEILPAARRAFGM